MVRGSSSTSSAYSNSHATGYNLATVQTEHALKLKSKFQQESDLLEDLRSYAQKRATIEKEYGQALQRLAAHYNASHKDCLGIVPETIRGRISAELRDCHSSWQVWRELLEHTDLVGRAHIFNAEALSQQVAEPCKCLQKQRASTYRKATEQLRIIHAELSQSYNEMVELQKNYLKEEKVTEKARHEAAEADDKVHRRATGLFGSMASLQQKRDKLQQKRQQCEAKAALCRNEYLLAVAACHTHQQRYFRTDLNNLLDMLDRDLHVSLRDFLSIACDQLLQTAQQAYSLHSDAYSHSLTVNRAFSLEHFLLANPVFVEEVAQKPELLEGDPINRVTKEFGCESQLDDFALNFAREYVCSDRQLRAVQHQLTSLQQQQLTLQQSAGDRGAGATFGKQDRNSALLLTGSDHDLPKSSSMLMEASGELSSSHASLLADVEETKQILRKAETEIAKLTAKIDLLREAGVEVDSLIEEANMKIPEISQVSEPTKVAASPDSVALEVKSPVEAGPAETGPAEAGPAEAEPVETDNNYYEAEATGVDQLEASAGYDQAAAGSTSLGTAIYEYEASTTDELNLEVGETVEIVGVGDGEGWILARNQYGQMGYVPEAFVQIQPYESSNRSSSCFDYGQAEPAATSPVASAVDPAGWPSQAPASAGASSSVSDGRDDAFVYGVPGEEENVVGSEQAADEVVGEAVEAESGLTDETSTTEVGADGRFQLDLGTTTEEVTMASSLERTANQLASKAVEAATSTLDSPTKTPFSPTDTVFSKSGLSIVHDPAQDDGGGPAEEVEQAGRNDDDGDDADHDQGGGQIEEDDQDEDGPKGPGDLVGVGDTVYAAYDYTPTNDDELMLAEGMAIKVLKRDDTFGDGWWMGQTDDGVTGVFPSILVSSNPDAAHHDDYDSSDGDDDTASTGPPPVPPPPPPAAPPT